MDWLSNTLSLYKEYEAPQRFNYWSLLTAVSAILQDRVYFDRFRYKLYPNIYVILFGPSGIMKGPPISLAKSIVTRVGNTRVINGRSTVEAIMKELSLAVSKPNSPPHKHNNGFISASEMSSSVVSSTSSLDILTDLADRIYNTDEWSYRTKNSETIRLVKPTITMLSGTNEALFREFVPDKNLKGGLIGRTFVVYETEPNCINSLMDRPSIIPDEDIIAQGISHIKNLNGEFKISDDTRSQFKEWYHQFKTEIAPKLEDETGSVNRADDNVLKLAMLISCARRADLIITADDIKEAMTEVLPMLVRVKKITTNAKQSEITKQEKLALILKYLCQCEDYSATREEVLRKFSMKMDAEDLDRIIGTLGQAKAVETSNAGGVLRYTLNVKNEKVRDYVEQFKK